MAADAVVVAGPERKAKVGYRSLFGIRDYRLLFAGLVTSMSGSWAYNVGLVVYVFNATHSPAWVAAASMARFLSALLSSASASWSHSTRSRWSCRDCSPPPRPSTHPCY
jgi:hypothetical protein